MGQLVDLQYKIKKYFAFTPAEIRGVIITIVAIAFIISFNDWGSGNVFNATIGVFNFINALIITTLAILVHISAQRICALAGGFRLEWRMWGIGLALGVIMAFLSNGKLWLLLPGGIVIHHLGGHRLGWFRYDISVFALAMIALCGPLASITLAVLFNGIGAVVGNALVQKAVLLNVVIALYSLLPIPPLDGSRIFFGSRMLYVFAGTGIIVISALLVYTSIGFLLALLFSVLIAIAMWIAYFYFFESQWWDG